MDDDAVIEAARIAGRLRASLARVQEARRRLSGEMERNAALRRDVEYVECHVLARYYALAGKVHVAGSSPPR